MAHVYQFASVVADSSPWYVACQVPLSIEFSRQEHCSGWPFPSPDHPDPGIEPLSLESPTLEAGSLPLVPLGKIM